MNRSFSFLQGIEQLYPVFQSSIPNIGPHIQSLFQRVYPHKILYGDSNKALNNLFKRYHLSSDKTESKQNQLFVKEISSSDNSNQAFVKLGSNINENNIILNVPRGKEISKNDSSTNYVPTFDTESIIADMIQDHSLNQDMCLVCFIMYIKYLSIYTYYFYRLEKKVLVKPLLFKNLQED